MGSELSEVDRIDRNYVCHFCVLKIFDGWGAKSHGHGRIAPPPGSAGGRIQIVSTCIHLSPSTCILYRRQNCRQFVARRCCWIYKGIQVDRDIVIMSPRYSLQVSRTSNLYPSTCISGRYVSWSKRGI